MPAVSSLPSDTASLLRRAASRDEDAARLLVEQLGPLVRRIILSHPPLHREADDLTQEIFFRIFRDAVRWRGDGPPEHWVSRVAKFTCIDRLRRLRARPETRWSDLTPAEQSLLEGRSGETPVLAEGRNAASLLEKLLSSLPPQDAWLLREVELAQRPPSEVAAEAGWNSALARVRLFRARRRLREAYAKLDPP